MNRYLTPSEAREFVWARTPPDTRIEVTPSDRYGAILSVSRFFTHYYAASDREGFDQRKLVEAAFDIRRADAWDNALTYALAIGAIMVWGLSLGGQRD